MDEQLNDINNKFLVGNHITDEELFKLVEKYKILIDNIQFLDKSFELFIIELYRRYNSLCSYKNSRERKY